MSLSFRGSFTCLLFCGFFAFFSLNVLAQDNYPEQTYLIKSPAGILKSQSAPEENSNENITVEPDNSKIINDQETEISEAKPEIFGKKSQTKFFNYNFDLNAEPGKFADFDEIKNDRKLFPKSPPDIPSIDKSKKNDAPDESPAYPENRGFRWGPAINQSLIFLAVQHGYAMTQPKTRESLQGKFFKDYANSVKALRGWDDGGRFFTNYIAHPMQGSLTGFIYVQNDPKAINQQFGKSGGYWSSRMKAMAWSAIWSTQFEIGPVSQASIGNVGLSGKQTWEDIVITPTLGTAMLIMEDATDRFIMQSVERKTNNFYVKIFLRMILSPTRVFANMLRFKTPWHRDRPYNY